MDPGIPSRGRTYDVPVRAFWIGLGAGAALVGLGILIGLQIQEPAPAPEPAPAAPPAPDLGVRITGAQSNAGWIVYFHLPERARQVDYMRQGEDTWIPLGPNPHDIDLATGKPRSKTYAMLDLAGPTRFTVRYSNDAGQLRGPYAILFDPTAESVRTFKSLLDDLPRWIEYRRFDGKLYAYFTTLLVYKPALAGIRYGVDRATPNRALQFAASTDLGVESTDQMMIELAPGTRFVAVEVALRDGTAMRRTFPVD